MEIREWKGNIFLPTNLKYIVKSVARRLLVVELWCSCGRCGFESDKQHGPVTNSFLLLSIVHVQKKSIKSYLCGKLLQSPDVDGTFLRRIQVTPPDTQVWGGTHHPTRQTQWVVWENGPSGSIIILWTSTQKRLTKPSELHIYHFFEITYWQLLQRSKNEAAK